MDNLSHVFDSSSYIYLHRSSKLCITLRDMHDKTIQIVLNGDIKSTILVGLSI